MRACAVIVHKEKVLVLWRKFNGKEYFVFPGGGVEENETLENAVIREAFEETSLIVKVERFLYKLNTPDIENNFYLCSYISGEPKLGNANEVQEITETNDYKPMWKNISEFPELDFKPQEIKEWFVNDSINGFPEEPKVYERA